jgi:hypothetical protein
MCCASQIPRGADLLVTFIPKSIGRRPNLFLRGRHHPWEDRHHGTRNTRVGFAPFSPPLRQTSLLGGPPPQDVQPRGLHPRCALYLDGPPSPAVTPDDDVDPPMLSRPTMSVVANGDPSPMARVPPVPRVVTDCLECYRGARVWLQDRLSGVVTNCL